VLQGAPDVAEVNQAAAAFGLVVDSGGPQPLELWAELLPAVLIFQGMRTQWRVGPNGATGLDFCALPVVEQRMRITRRQSREAFPYLVVMQDEALRWFDSKRGG
jgi:hypothetical protein